LRVLATYRDASKHSCQGIALGDSRNRLRPLRGSAFGLGQPGGYAAGASRSGDMSNREAESNNGIGIFEVRGFDRINRIYKIG
jgi:hypothetical protein